MRRIKKNAERSIRISISISPEINKHLEFINNKSKYIEYVLLEYFNHLSGTSNKNSY